MATQTDVPPYDPDRPLSVRHADVIAARNAVACLVNFARNERLALTPQQREHLRHLLPTAVAEVDDGPLSDEGLVDELVALRDRLRNDLPWPGDTPSPTAA